MILFLKLINGEELIASTDDAFSTCTWEVCVTLEKPMKLLLLPQGMTMMPMPCDSMIIKRDNILAHGKPDTAAMQKYCEFTGSILPASSMIEVPNGIRQN